MNKSQLKSMWIGIGIVIVMALFPPWIGSKNNGPVGFAGYSLIYKQPKYTIPASSRYTIGPDGKRTDHSRPRTRRHYSQAQVDYRLLSLQIFLVLLITGGAIVQTGARPKPKV